jgi:nucleotide-binding universal stress UspA family protein
VAHGDSERGDSERGEFDSSESEADAEPRFELGTDGPSVILAGVDESITAARAGAYAAGLARRQGARLVIVYVSPTPYVAGPSAAAVSVVAAEAEAHDAIAAELRAQVEDAARDRGIPITFLTAHGDPYTEIKRVAAEMRADAIVVGASAKAGHKLVGSLAVRLVRAGKWPVTVVP